MRLDKGFVIVCLIVFASANEEESTRSSRSSEGLTEDQGNNYTPGGEDQGKESPWIPIIGRSPAARAVFRGAPHGHGQPYRGGLLHLPHPGPLAGLPGPQGILGLGQTLSPPALPFAPGHLPFNTGYPPLNLGLAFGGGGFGGHGYTFNTLPAQGLSLAHLAKSLGGGLEGGYMLLQPSGNYLDNHVGASHVAHQVPVVHQVPVAVPHPVPVQVPHPVPVKVPLPVPVQKTVQVPVERPVPVPVEKPYPVHLLKQLPVPVAKPYPVPVPVYKTKYVYHKGQQSH